MNERDTGTMGNGGRGIGEAHGGPRESVLKSRKGFGYRVRQAKARPSNTTIRDLLSDGWYTEAALVLLRAARVGEVKEGAICT